MPSEHRLHPASILFNLGAQAKELLIPGLVVLFGARSGADTWQIWAMVLLIPYLFVAVGRYMSFRYRYDTHELVIRWGLIFRNERHIPYARIQNLDAVQNLFHRWLGVVKVRLETGGGQEPEATMSVLPRGAFDEMRVRVFEGRGAGAGVVAPLAPDASGLEAPDAAAVPAAPPGVVLLRLEPRDLLIAGLIENRGMVLIAALFGVIYEAGLLNGVMDSIFGEETSGRGAIRSVFRSVFGGDVFPWREALMMAGALVGLLLGIRVLSAIWGLIRLYGFTLTRTGEDLRSEFGLFTRVTATIPMRRIQTLTVFEGPWHRWFGWAAVRVATAGGAGTDGSVAQREWLAPIIGRDRLDRFLVDVLPEVTLEQAVWEPVHPRAFGRELRVRSVIVTAICAGLLMWLGWWDVPLFVILLAWTAFAARKYVKHLGWSLTSTAVIFRSGWIWRHQTVARFTRIQAVTLQESPFDRRTGMASVRVDTAGGGAAHDVDIPYLGRPVAASLFAKLSAEAAQTEFRW